MWGERTFFNEKTRYKEIWKDWFYTAKLLWKSIPKIMSSLINWQAENLQAIGLTDEKKIWWKDDMMK